MRCSSATAFSSGNGSGGRRLVNRETRERQAGNVHFLDRPARVLQRSTGASATSSRPAARSSSSRRAASRRRAPTAVRGRPARTPTPRRRSRRPRPAARVRSRQRGCAGTPTMRNSPAARRPRDGRAGVGAHISDADEGRPHAMPPAADVVGQHADADDVVRSRERCEFRLRNGHRDRRSYQTRSVRRSGESFLTGRHDRGRPNSKPMATAMAIASAQPNAQTATARAVLL